MRRKLHFALIACFLFSLSIFAQERNCGTMEVLQRAMQENPDLEQRMSAIETLIQNKIQEKKENPNARMDGVIYIPVVVHVVYNTEQENISDAQILSQIDVIYKDFRRLNDDADDVWAQAADMEIEFYMARVDPDGNPTTGITRTQTTVAAWGFSNDMKYTDRGGKDPWDTSRYFNFWTANMGGGLLGFAQFPGGSPETDGIVMGPNFFGSSDYDTNGDFFLSAPFDKGRTTTHEMGHFFNLRHIWGDDVCGVDDFVADTPESDASNGGCAIGHVSCGSVDMVQNYMDYSDDACMNLFTEGQKDRMRATIEDGGPRDALTEPLYDFAMVPAVLPAVNELCAPITSDIVVDFTYYTYPTFTEDATFTASGLPAGASATFSPTSASADGTPVVMTITGLNGAATGNYNISIDGTSTSASESVNVTLDILDDTFAASSLTSPADAAIDQPAATELMWAADSNASEYDVELATDAAFTTIVQTATVNTNAFTTANLLSETQYWWRITPKNICGVGAASTANSFTTAFFACTTTDSSDTPLDIPDGDLDGVNSTISITTPSQIEDVNVTLNITHSWDADIDVYLESPSGTRIALTLDNGGTGDNYIDTVFDDDAADPIGSGTPPFTGTFQPTESLAAFNGESSGGIWTLNAIDDEAILSGTLDSWSLEICGVPLPDSDGDGIDDFADNCPMMANIDQADNDGDGIGDVCDDDDDNDGFNDDVDNCPLNANPDQFDGDGNGIGDACEVACVVATNSEPLDIATNGVVYSMEVDIPNNIMPTDINVTLDITHTWNSDLLFGLANPNGDIIILSNRNGGSGDNYADTVFDDDADTAIADGTSPFAGSFMPEEPLSTFNFDNTGMTAAGTWTFLILDQAAGDTGTVNYFTLEVCGLRPALDLDEDGITNVDDNCPLTANDDQSDIDGDGLGDLCDPDMDGDGVLNENDNCPMVVNPNQIDTDGDGLGNLCDDDDDDDGILDEFDNCPLTFNPDQIDRDRNGIGDVCDGPIANQTLTPNGDGVNDTWTIINIERYPQSKVRVYNRWGNEVFNATGYGNNWNGTSDGNGKPLPSGSYYYQIDVNGDGGKPIQGWLYITL